MDKQEINDKLLEKIDMAIDCIASNRDPEYNERISCVVCNLASAYEALDKCL